MKNESTSEPSRSSRSGGCSLGCAWFFVLIGIVWPLLHVLGGSYEPGILLFPVLLGLPVFVATHILAVIALFSKSAETRRSSQWALRIIWGGIVFFLFAAVVGLIVDSIR